LEIQSVRIDGSIPDTAVVHVIPAWDIDEQMEWCIRGRDELVYVGQFVLYHVERYARLRESRRATKGSN
jgi:hypothetical protein